MVDEGAGHGNGAPYPAAVRIQPAMEGRNRLTAAFRFFLSLPHLILVGGPAAYAVSVTYSTEGGGEWELGSGGGLVGIVAWLAAVFSWFAILVTGRHPKSLWELIAFYMRWRVKAITYFALLRDEYPPFGEGAYPADLEVTYPDGPRDRLTVFFRLFMALPHLIVLGFLNLAWAFTTALAWAVILFTGRYPESLYGFGIGVLAWTIRVEAYLLLLRDEYPPFTLRF